MILILIAIIILIFANEQPNETIRFGGLLIGLVLLIAGVIITDKSQTDFH